MSNYPENVIFPPEDRNDSVQHEIDSAENALDAIDALAKQFADRIREVCSMPLMDVSVRDAARAVAEFNDTLTDLFHAQRIRLMDIAGWRSGYEPNPYAIKSTSEILFNSLQPSKF